MANGEYGTITKQLLKCKSGEFDLESIQSLNLNKLGIKDLGCIGECSVLESLDLSQNNATRLYALSSLTNLVYLNLSGNAISSLEGLQALDNLVKLNLAGNLINGVDTLRSISCLENLTNLRLQDKIQDLTNPLCNVTSYKADVTEMLPNLIVLDGERLSGKGSDLFKIYQDMDKHIDKSKSYSSGSTLEPSGNIDWVPSDYWKLDTKEFTQSSLADAEQQLESLLTSCQTVLDESDAHISDLIRDDGDPT